MEHRISSALIGHPVRIHLAGCGGSGSQMLTGLARLNHALRALDHPGLSVIAYDPDDVSPANVGRQLFAPGDVGHNKAAVLVNRINAFFGVAWSAAPREFRHNDKVTDLVITCVDTRAARRFINTCLTDAKGISPPPYWMDLGNRTDDGQVVLGCPASSQKAAAHKDRLPTVAELFPEIIKGGREDNTPSCSLAEALERQHLFVNQAVVTAALQILWTLLRFGKLTWHGAFVNLKTGRTTPLPVDIETWARMKGSNAKEPRTRAR